MQSIILGSERTPRGTRYRLRVEVESLSAITVDIKTLLRMVKGRPVMAMIEEYDPNSANRGNIIASQIFKIRSSPWRVTATQLQDLEKEMAHWARENTGQDTWVV